MIIFTGEQRAAQREEEVKLVVAAFAKQDKKLKIAAILFEEDAGSRLYTRLKKEAAERVGIEYEIHAFSLEDGTAEIEETLAALNADQTVTGIIIQKPYRRVWSEVKGIDQTAGVKAVRQAYSSWWQFLTSLIAPEKDVDGLHPSTLEAVKNGTWQEQGRVLPATARAVLLILDEAFEKLGLDQPKQKELTMFVLGRSDIVGLPVFYELTNRGYQVRLLTRDDLEQRQKSGKNLSDGDVVISATGAHNLLNAEMFKENSIVIDVGEPKPDVQRDGLENKVAFLTPVPGGVGPMTVVCLLENCGILAAR
jgi:methylenetetrahydrofolate dehydrogenase (NADP+) / methenyltetrahydrofolate cyclohydrolase